MKIITVRQTDIKDCGPCCLKSIIEYYDGYVPLSKIKDDCLTSKEGTTVYHLINAATKYGFDAIAKKSEDKKLNNVILPAIVHVVYPNGLNHYMVLYQINKKNVIVMNPSKGKEIISYNEFNNLFTGVFIEIYPKESIVLFEKNSKVYDLIINIIKGNKKICASLLLSGLLLTICTIISGLYFKVSYNAIILNKEIKHLIYLFLIVTFLKITFEFTSAYYKNYLNKNIDVSLFSNFIKHIFNLPLKVINKKSTGEIISRVEQLTSIKDLFSEILITSFLDLMLSIGTIICLFLINKKLALFLLSILVVYIIIVIVYNPYIYKRINQNIDYSTETNSILIENINMINSIKNLNKTSYGLKKIENVLANFLFDNFSFTNFLNNFNTLKSFVLEIGIFIINTYGFYLIYISKLSLIDLVTFNTLMYYAIDPVKNVTFLIPKINFFRASFNKINDFLDIKEEVTGKNENFINGDIKFENVSFSYNDYNNVLDNVCLKIKQGEKIMIKGKSGSGKSTICQLLYRLYDPNKGNILINNKNIKDYNLETIRNNIVYVGQKENVFTGTIENNILLDESKNEIFDKVCKVCLIEDIVNKKPFRYQFGIENNSQNVSGGEKQRIVLARALLKHSNILILDEALSEVDYNLEKKIINNIKKEFSNKTLLYITHKKQDNLFDRTIILPDINYG